MDKKIIAGWVASALMGGVMILVGSSKIFGFAPEEIVTNLNSIGLGEEIKVIGFLEVSTAILFLIPRTLSAGTLLVCSFWGGAIVAHLAMGNNEYFPALVLGGLAWVGAYLRQPEIFSSFAGKSEATAPTASGE